MPAGAWAGRIQVPVLVSVGRAKVDLASDPACMYVRFFFYPEAVTSRDSCLFNTSDFFVFRCIFPVEPQLQPVIHTSARLAYRIICTL